MRGPMTGSRIEPGTLRFRVWCCAPSRNDGESVTHRPGMNATEVCESEPVGSPQMTTQLDLHDDRELLDALVAIGVQEGVVILERHAAVGIAVGAEHVGMREQADTAIYSIIAADRIEPQRRHAVEQRLARLQFVDVRR